MIGLLLYHLQLRFKVLKPRILILLRHVLLELICLLVDGTHSRRKSLREFGGVEVLLRWLAVLGDLGEMRFGRIRTPGFHYVSKLYQFKYIAGQIIRAASSSREGFLLTIEDGHLGLVLLLDSEVFFLVEVCLLAGLLVTGLQLVLDVLPHRVTQEVYGLLCELLVFVGFQTSELLLVG